MPANAAKPVDFTVTYTNKCPECAKTGNPDVAIGFSFEAGGIVCQTGGHTFSALPGDAGTQAVTPPKQQQGKKLATDGAFAARPKAEPEIAETAAPAPLPVQVAPEKVQVLDPLPLVNGDLEIKLRIPERFAQAVQAEAEVQRQPLEEYLQNWIEYALENNWGR